MMMRLSNSFAVTLLVLVPPLLTTTVQGQLVGFDPGSEPSNTTLDDVDGQQEDDPCRVIYIEDPSATIDPDNNGKLVYFHAPLTFDQGAVDPLFGACAANHNDNDDANGDYDEESLQCLSMYRSVETFLWEEKKSCPSDGDDAAGCSVNYTQKWVFLDDIHSACVTCERNSTLFLEPQGHQNPNLVPNLESARFQANNVRIGPFQVPADLYLSEGPNAGIMHKDRIPGATELALHEANYAIGHDDFGGWYFKYMGADEESINATINDNSDSEETVGDVRIEFLSLFALSQNPAFNMTAGSTASFTVLAKQQDEFTLAPYDLNCDVEQDPSCTTPFSHDLVVNVYRPGGPWSLEEMTKDLQTSVLPTGVFCLSNPPQASETTATTATAPEVTGTTAATTAATTTTTSEEESSPVAAPAASPIASPTLVFPNHPTSATNPEEEPTGNNSLLSSAENVLTLIAVAMGVGAILFWVYRRNFGRENRRRTQLYNQAAMSAIDEFENDIEMRPID